MFLLGILRLGFIDVLLSRALLTGFITAMGLIISMLVIFLGYSYCLLTYPLVSLASS